MENREQTNTPAEPAAAPVSKRVPPPVHSRWKKGQSGNPKGRGPDKNKGVKKNATAQEYADAALREMWDLATNDKTPAEVRRKTLKDIYEAGYGRATKRIGIEAPAFGPDPRQAQANELAEEMKAFAAPAIAPPVTPQAVQADYRDPFAITLPVIDVPSNSAPARQGSAPGDIGAPHAGMVESMPHEAESATGEGFSDADGIPTTGHDSAAPAIASPESFGAQRYAPGRREPEPLNPDDFLPARREPVALHEGRSASNSKMDTILDTRLNSNSTETENMRRAFAMGVAVGQELRDDDSDD